jgi:hypothetical protein
VHRILFLRLSAWKENTGEVILQIPSLFSATSYYEVTNTEKNQQHGSN